MMSSSFFLLCLATANAAETWHLVDIAQVVCPKPVSSNPNAPPFPEYNLGINYTSSLQVDAPHIVSFIRASQQAVSITFSIEDSNGQEVVPETTVQLQELSDTVPSSCKCTMPTLPAEVQETYGQNYGAQCGAWDNPNCGELWGNMSLGAWCCRPWCYATSDCPDAYSSQALPGQFFSYAACNTFAPVSPCTWTAVAEQNDPCKCKDASSLFSADMRSKFADNYGSTCGTWDMQNCATNYRPDQVDTWCCASWCYVDKECSSAIQSLNAGMEGILFWSDNVCDDDPALVVQCPYKPQPVVPEGDTSCNCLGITMDSTNLARAGLNSTYANYGQQCDPHDANICEITYPRANHDMWCCMSWCWVDESCPTSRASTVWPGHFWSTETCTMNADVVSGCKYSRACECRGQLPGGALPDTFASDYGSSCNDWDSSSCKATWYHNPDGGWNTSADHEWCCDAWCYVDEACPIAKQSWLGIGYYFSYETCDDPAATYNESADTCDATNRRLQAQDTGPGVDTESAALGRQLSARRRGGSSWGSSSSRGGWSPRRRSPPAPPTSPRRRAPSAPSVWSPRRRAPVSPRRRDVRRRAPPPPVPAPVNTRRRTTSINGQTYSANPRRRFGTTGVPSPPAVPYGYANRPQLMNNYGGTMPYQTPYGYSGYNAVPAQSRPNVAMYAVGGAVVGAGAMYAFNSMYGDAYGYEVFRRRRINDFRNPDYCIVTAPGSRNGAFMECQNCYRLYGYSMCPSARSCNTAAGCSYTTPQSFNRDDLAATGFIPKDFRPPLKVLFKNISGAGIDTDPITGICPPTTRAEADLVENFNKTMSFKPDLFLVLTQQQTLRSPAASGCDSDTSTSCSTTCWIAHSTCVNGACMCQQGYCWNGNSCSSSGSMVSSSYQLPEWFSALLALYILSHWL